MREVDGSAGHDPCEEAHGRGVVVPLHPQAVPTAPPAAPSTRRGAVEMPGGYLRALGWSLSDPDRGLGGTVLTHGPHGLGVGEPDPVATASASPAPPAPLRGAG
ncbi:hypothetical protein [Actinomyces lilanjuaniae]|uniref:hypothetical protein n=1 Tax=Actinomyces lilanjuaniae TaxID=2321394 RepID=UPI0013C4554C|nr:hypothetical protein [Actinomyces lilanjuaniae]